MNQLYRNIIVLVIAICFSAAGLIGEKTSAQTNKTAKAAPTPKTKKSPAAIAKTTPKPTPKTTPKAKQSDASKTAKTSDKTKTLTQTAKTKSAAPKDKPVATAKNGGDSNKSANKTKTDVTAKTTPKSSAKSTLKPTTKTASKTTLAPKSAPKSNIEEQVIVTAAARIHEQPKANAAQLGSVKIGKTLPVSEKNAAWYRVEYETGKSGWISKTTVKDYETTSAMKFTGK
jgi:hypothetical protein